MKRIFATAALVLSAFIANAQTATPSPETAKLDSLTKLAQRYLNAEQPDSLYALMGDAFKKQVSLAQAKEITKQIHGQLGNWVSADFKSIKDGVAKYKANFAVAALDFYISRDAEGKIYTFLFQPAKE